MADDKVDMPADGSGTKMRKPDEIGELAGRRDSDMPGGLPNTGESGGGPYPNPYDEERDPRFQGGQSALPRKLDKRD